jgi:hypothetical protein
MRKGEESIGHGAWGMGWGKEGNWNVELGTRNAEWGQSIGHGAWGMGWGKEGIRSLE